MSGKVRRLTVGAVGVLLSLAVGAAPPANASEPDAVVPLIIGGVDATQPYPPVTSLQLDRDGTFGHNCAAVLVHPRYVVTAAHCVTDWEAEPIDPATLRIRAGSAKHASGGRIVAVTKVVPHPAWDWHTGDGLGADVAVLRLAAPVWLPRYPILGRSPAIGSTVREVGWGSTEPVFAGSFAATLQQLDRWVVPPEECAGGGITVDEICIGGAPGGACFGDSGGPGLYRIGRTWSVVAGTSRVGVDWRDGVYCGVQMISTDLTFHRSWIRSVIRGSRST